MQSAKDILELLGGYAKANPADMAKLGECSDWQALAKWEVTRRAARLLDLFDDQTLAAIASGEIDLQDLCQQAAAGQKGAR
jgi:hypothetical protein